MASWSCRFLLEQHFHPSVLDVWTRELRLTQLVVSAITLWLTYHCRQEPRLVSVAARANQQFIVCSSEIFFWKKKRWGKCIFLSHPKNTCLKLFSFIEAKQNDGWCPTASPTIWAPCLLKGTLKSRSLHGSSCMRVSCHTRVSLQSLEFDIVSHWLHTRYERSGFQTPFWTRQKQDFNPSLLLFR